MLVTPDIARDLLIDEPLYPLTNAKVEEFVDKILSGAFTAEPGVDFIEMSAGRTHLSDGRHRLAAIIQSGATVELQVNFKPLKR
jgi:hypothetical protein